MRKRLALEEVVRIHSWIEETQKQCVRDIRAVIWDNCPNNSSALRHANSINLTLEKFRQSIWEQLDVSGRKHLKTLNTDEAIDALGGYDAPYSYFGR